MRNPFKEDRSVVIAGDVEDLNELDRVLETAGDVEGVEGCKIGLLALRYSLPEIVRHVREKTDLMIIHDHEKGGNFPRHQSEYFADSLKMAGVDAAILFPFAGYLVQKDATDALIKRDIETIIGSDMTHDMLKRSEGGYIDDRSGIEGIYLNAASSGVVDHFVFPANRQEESKHYKSMIDPIVRVKTRKDPVYLATGFGTQGGNLREYAKMFEGHFHPILGRYITKAENMREAAKEAVKILRETA